MTRGASSNMAYALQDMGRIEEAGEAFRRTLQVCLAPLQPHPRLTTPNSPPLNSQTQTPR